MLRAAAEVRDQPSADGQLLHRRGALAGQRIVGAGVAEVGGQRSLPQRDVGVELAQLVGREQAPAIVVEGPRIDEHAEVVVMRAIADFAHPPAERPALEGGRAARVVEAVLHGHDDRAAQRIEAIDRVGPHHVEAVDGAVGDQVPVHRVAERLIDAHAVLVDRETLRRAQHRRGGEAAVEQVRLELVVEVGGEVDAADQPVERRRGVRRADGRKIVTTERVHGVGRLGDVDGGPGQRRDGDHRHRRRLGGHVVGCGLGWRARQRRRGTGQQQCDETGRANVEAQHRPPADTWSLCGGIWSIGTPAPSAGRPARRPRALRRAYARRRKPALNA